MKSESVSTILKACKFVIYPTKRQKRIIEDSLRTDKFIFNYFLGIEDETNKVLKMYNDSLDKKELSKFRTKNKIWFNKFDASRHLTKLSKTEKYNFLQLSSSTLRGYTLESLDNAFKKMIKEGSGYPRFKKESNSYKVQIQSEPKLEHINNKYYKILIPSSSKNKLGLIKTKIHNEEILSNLANIKSCTVSTKDGKYYASFQYDTQIPIPSKKKIVKDTTIGIDLGIKRIITSSREEDFNTQKYDVIYKSFKEVSKKINELSSILGKKRHSNPNWKKSNSYKRLHKNIHGLQTKKANILNNLRHNISNDLTNIEDIDTLIFEKLNIKNMSKKSGKNLSNNKRGLNRSLVELGLSDLVEKTKYKATWKGKNVEFVDPKYTSQKCNSCGHISKENRQKQDTFKCVKCGESSNADLNAAKNIKEKFFI